MINWKEFELLIGNGKRKWLKRGKEEYHLVSYNKELKEISVMNKRSERTILSMPLKYFLEDFTLIRVGPEKPLF